MTAQRSACSTAVATAAQLGVHEYPTLLLTLNGVTRRLGGPVTKPEQLIRQLDPALVAAA